jgi:hydroxymethylpyrimidine pyrophosphatase-like HAD family hydrolase
MDNKIVIISDLDGTLLNQHHTISEYTKSCFSRTI